MKKIKDLQPERVFAYFEKISSIPRGSGNMKAIADFCVDFAKQHSLKVVRDDANNVVIFKDASAGYENSEPVILQGHLDMVCQKTDDCKIDFEKDGLELYVDGDFLKAKGTTLGADNGIAAAMIMAVLESDTISHPPIEAVFTTDEEIGMIGAGKLDMSILKGKKMINLDVEEPELLTVSCAGGSDFTINIDKNTRKANGRKITITLKGLKGGHSGVEIDSGRINADILAGRILSFAKNNFDFEIISINGGDKANAIPNACEIELCVNDKGCVEKLQSCIDTIKTEIRTREPDFTAIITDSGDGEYSVLGEDAKEKLIIILLTAPNGVLQMSADIENLVETSMNLGIMKTEENSILLHFSLRSNKQSALDFLEEKLTAFADYAGVKSDRFGHYPPWEFKENSPLQSLYKKIYNEQFGEETKIVAIHAGLECGIFASAIKDFDCIAIGPRMFDIHTVNERLSISSTAEMFNLLKNLLKECK